MAFRASQAVASKTAGVDGRSLNVEPSRQESKCLIGPQPWVARQIGCLRDPSACSGGKAFQQCGQVSARQQANLRLRLASGDAAHGVPIRLRRKIARPARRNETTTAKAPRLVLAETSKSSSCDAPRTDQRKAPRANDVWRQQSRHWTQRAGDSQEISRSNIQAIIKYGFLAESICIGGTIVTTSADSGP